MILPCPFCGCADAAHAVVHSVQAALLDGDVDRAIEFGLLGAARCPHCTPDCGATLEHARDARLAALAARERFRARQQRLARREHERAAARSPVSAPGDAAPVAAALPPAVADVLARAKARAAGKAP